MQANPAPSMFSQKLIHEGGRRVARPRTSRPRTRGRRHASRGSTQASVSSRHLLNRSTGIPRKDASPPQSE